MACGVRNERRVRIVILLVQFRFLPKIRVNTAISVRQSTSPRRRWPLRRSLRRSGAFALLGWQCSQAELCGAVDGVRQPHLLDSRRHLLRFADCRRADLCRTTLSRSATTSGLRRSPRPASLRQWARSTSSERSSPAGCQIATTIAGCWYYGLRGLEPAGVAHNDFSLYGLSIFAVFYGWGLDRDRASDGETDGLNIRA